MIRNKVGREYPPVVWEVDRSKIREMALAIGDDNPIYHDTEAAKSNGYQDIVPVPINFAVCSHWGNIMGPIFEDLNIDTRMVLHGQQSYEYLRDYYPGDVLTGLTKVKNVEEKISKSGAKMRIIEVEIMLRNQNGEDVLKQTTVIVERLAL